jgi:hypothetical protein
MVNGGEVASHIDKAGQGNKGMWRWLGNESESKELTGAKALKDMKEMKGRRGEGISESDRAWGELARWRGCRQVGAGTRQLEGRLCWDFAGFHGQPQRSPYRVQMGLDTIARLGSGPPMSRPYAQ